jgi:hypothetical protein
MWRSLYELSPTISIERGLNLIFGNYSMSESERHYTRNFNTAHHWTHKKYFSYKYHMYARLFKIPGKDGCGEKQGKMRKEKKTQMF